MPSARYIYTPTGRGDRLGRLGQGTGARAAVDSGQGSQSGIARLCMNSSLPPSLADSRSGISRLPDRTIPQDCWGIGATVSSNVEKATMGYLSVRSRRPVNLPARGFRGSYPFAPCRLTVGRWDDTDVSWAGRASCPDLDLQIMDSSFVSESIDHVKLIPERFLVEKGLQSSSSGMIACRPSLAPPASFPASIFAS